MRQLSAASEASTPVPLRIVTVSPTGDDASWGADGQSVRSLHRARDIVRQLRASANGPVAVRLQPGRYELRRPLELSTEDGGRSEADEVVWEAVGDEPVVVSGGARIKGPWQRLEATGSLPVWRRPLPADATANQLWVCGERAKRARHPNVGSLRWRRALVAPFGGWGLVYEAGQGLEDMGDALLGAEAVVHHSWTASRHTVAAHLPSRRTLLFAQPAHAPLGTHLRQSGRRFYLEHARAFLDAPGEWVVQRASGEDGWLLVASDAPPGADCEDDEARVVVSRGLPALLVAGGTPEAPLRHLTLRRLSWEHTEWSMPPPPQPADFQAAAWLPTAAVHVRHATDVKLEGGGVRRTGGYAVWLGEGTERCALRNASLDDLGAGGVRLGVAELEAPRATGHTVEGVTITRGGRVWREGVGVLLQRAERCAVVECEIGHLGYTGVSLGWEWGYATPSGAAHNVIARNFIHHIGTAELADMGGVYVLGHSEGTRIEDNVVAHVQSYHLYGWGIYLDEGASGVVVRRNVVHHTTGGGLHQHYGTNNTVQNNTFACAGGADGDVALSVGEAHESFHFARNLVLRCPLPAPAPASATAEPEPAGGGGGGGDGGGGGGGRGGAGACYPATPAYLLWWKGEGITPRLRFGANLFWSLIGLETDLGQPEHLVAQMPILGVTTGAAARTGIAPPWLHFGVWGVDMKRWAKKGWSASRDDSQWSDPGFVDAANCDYRLERNGAAAALGHAQPAIPLPARGRDGGGDGGGCGERTAWPEAEPAPLSPPAEAERTAGAVEEGDLDAAELARRLPGGAALLEAHEAAEAARAQPPPWRGYAEQVVSALLEGAVRPPCWRGDKAKKGKYLPGCTVDECAEHESLELATTLCEAWGGGCGGVTALTVSAGHASGGARTVYQTRAGFETVASPSKERSWLKRDCEAAALKVPAGGRRMGGEDVDANEIHRFHGVHAQGGGGGGGRSLVDSVPPTGGPCEVCRLIAADVETQLGSRKRSEMEVMDALDLSCDRLQPKRGEVSVRRQLDKDTCAKFMEDFSEDLEWTLVGSSGTAATVCESIVAGCKVSAP